jgi:hypothetical protein
LDAYLCLDLRPEYAPLLRLEAQRLLLLAQDLYVWPKSCPMLTQNLDHSSGGRSSLPLTVDPDRLSLVSGTAPERVYKLQTDFSLYTTDLSAGSDQQRF